MTDHLTNVESLLHEGTKLALARIHSYSLEELAVFCKNSVDYFENKNSKAQIKDEPFLERLTQLSIDAISVLGLHHSATILTYYSYYQEQIGNFRKGIHFGLIAVRLSDKHGDINLRRRAHGVLGIHFVRIYDFKMACHHLEKALKFAQKLKNPIFECTALSYISVLFHGMGLYRDSARIALKALSYPLSSLQLETLRVFNAVTLLRSSRIIGDVKMSDYSYNIVCEKINSKYIEPNSILTANFEFCRALHLLDRDMNDIATKYVDEALLRRDPSDNPRVGALLHTAKALCWFATGRPADIRKARESLRRLLHTTKEYPTHHEDVLRALIEVYSTTSTLRAKKISLGYAQQLRQYVRDERQARFSLQIEYGFDRKQIKAEKRRPNTNQTPSSLVERANVASSTMSAAFTEIQRDLANIRKNEIEGRFRSGAYSVAENWALAAEFSVESSGRHCFRVGKLAGSIAFNMGSDARKCLEVELACRLHDIGKMEVERNVFRMPREHELDEYRFAEEHAVAGERLLKCSTDPILVAAARVAKCHHEWWNGCGYPEGLRGDAIPLDARICAVADTYDILTNPRFDRTAWSHAEAVRQICAMANVQLDPNLMAPFLKAIEADVAARCRVTKEVDRSMACNQLARARKKLLDTLELVD